MKDQPNKLSQKDCDARWLKKNGPTFYGYKNHVKADAESVLITDYQVTDASVHDSQPLPDLIGPQNKNENLFADSAYKSAMTDEKLARIGINNWIHCRPGMDGSVLLIMTLRGLPGSTHGSYCAFFARHDLAAVHADRRL